MNPSKEVWINVYRNLVGDYVIKGGYNTKEFAQVTYPPIWVKVSCYKIKLEIGRFDKE